MRHYIVMVGLLGAGAAGAMEMEHSLDRNISLSDAMRGFMRSVMGQPNGQNLSNMRFFNEMMSCRLHEARREAENRPYDGLILLLKTEGFRLVIDEVVAEYFNRGHLKAFEVVYWNGGKFIQEALDIEACVGWKWSRLNTGFLKRDSTIPRLNAFARVQKEGILLNWEEENNRT